VLLLDEPTAALDPDGLSAFYDLIEARRRLGHTVLFSSHQLNDVARLADRLAVMVDGRLVATLTADEMSARLSSCNGRMDLFYRELVKGHGHA